MSTVSHLKQGTKEATHSILQMHRDVIKAQTSQDNRLNPVATPAPTLTSHSCSRQSYLASSTSPPSPPALPSPSSVASPSSASYPASLASSSIPPYTLCWPPLSWVSLCQPSWPATSSTRWCLSCTPSAPLSSSCPASTGSMACPLPNLPTGDSLEPMWPGLTITTRVTNTNSERHITSLPRKNIPIFRFCFCVLRI